MYAGLDEKLNSYFYEQFSLSMSISRKDMVNNNSGVKGLK